MPVLLQHHQPVTQYQLIIPRCKAGLTLQVFFTTAILINFSHPSFSDRKILSPSNLTKEDVNGIWFMIFRRFTSAVSLGKTIANCTICVYVVICDRLWEKGPYGEYAQFSVWPHICHWVIELVNPDYFITAN